MRLVRYRVCQNLSVNKEAGPDKNNGADRLHPKQREIAPSAAGALRQRRVGRERVIWLRHARGVIADRYELVSEGNFLCRRQILHVNLLDLAVELERRLVVIVERHWRSERYADVEAVVGGE